jgi:bifunctional enzyme CysN/CysC
VFKPGDDVLVLPGGHSSRITAIENGGLEVEDAFPPMSVTLRLADEIDISRGDMICRPHNQPTTTRELDAMVCWMSERPLRARGRYVLKHTTRVAKAMIEEVQYRVDVDTLHRDEAHDSLELNDIGRLRLRTGTPLLVDPYSRNRTTGSFILIDEATNDTVGAGMVLGAHG